MKISGAHTFTLDNGFVKKDVYIKDGFFVAAEDTCNSEVIDGSGCYLIPGLVDVHFHGCAGYDFSDCDIDGLKKIGRYELRNGVTSICPASMTFPEDKLLSICQKALKYSKDEDSTISRLCGINLEGPFISMEKRGAQNPEYINKPDAEMFRRLQEASGNLIKLVTIAPEVDGAIEFIDELSNDVHISVGHTMADYETAEKAFVQGADHVTHLYNAMPPLQHRESGVVGAAYDNDNVMVELICDGLHISAPVMRMTFDMFGADRVVIISDSMMATGMPDGEYALGGQPVTVRGSRATLADDTLAGSVTNLMDCMKIAVSNGIPLVDAVRCATYNPARSIGLDDKIGSIDVGKMADCVLLSRSDLSIKKVIKGGRCIIDL